MKLKQLIALAYAFSAGSLAIGLTAAYLNTLKFEMREHLKTKITKTTVKPAPAVTVVTATKPLSYGTRLRRSDLREMRVPATLAPLNVYHTVDSVFVTGKEPILQASLSAGALLTPAKVMQADEGAALAVMLPKNLRAVTIKINEVRGVGGFIQPRDRVDILLTENKLENENIQRTSRVLLQNVLVLAIGQEATPSDHRAKIKKSVTVAVNLRDAQKLALAVTVGELSLALRNPNHPVTPNPQSISLSDLRSGSIQVSAATSDIKVYRAAKATVYSFSPSSLQQSD